MARGGGYYLRLNKNNRGYLISVGQFTHQEKKLEGAHYGHDNSISTVGINIEDTEHYKEIPEQCEKVLQNGVE